MGSPPRSSDPAGASRPATSRRAGASAGTLLLACGVLTICLAAPAALVFAQEPAPPAATGPAQAAAGPEQTSPAAADQPPARPSPARPGRARPPAGPGRAGRSRRPPGATTAPPPSPATGDSTLVSAAGSTSVSILDGNSQSAFRFSPSSITVGAGDTVTWTNNGSAPEGHDVSGSGLGSGTLHNGQSYSHTFTSPGTFSYICSIHPFMKGTVTVQATSSGGGHGGGGGDRSRDAAHRGVPYRAGLRVRGGDIGGRGRKRRPAPLDRDAAAAAARRRRRAAARGRAAAPTYTRQLAVHRLRRRAVAGAISDAACAFACRSGAGRSVSLRRGHRSPGPRSPGPRSGHGSAGARRSPRPRARPRDRLARRPGGRAPARRPVGEQQAEVAEVASPEHGRAAAPVEG